MDRRLVVVGASYAGVGMAFAAREAGFAGDIVVLGDEGGLPYQRPPLSKAYLAGRLPLAGLTLKAQAAFDRARITLAAASPVECLDRATRTVACADGTVHDYDRLGLATGARPRRLTVPGADLAGIHVLRRLADADAIAAALPGQDRSAFRVLVVGGGFVGLETAAGLRGLGLAVTVVEPETRLLAHALHPVLSDWIADLHHRGGTDVRLGRRVVGFGGTGGRVVSATLDDGAVLAVDLVVVGIGADADDRLAAAAGLATDRGIIVGETGLTSDPAIAAAGDCTARPDIWAPPGTGLMRVQSVQNATDQARAAGATLAGVPTPHRALPWFWSDQFDAKIQMAGHGGAADQVVTRGDPAQGRFALFHFRAGRLAAVDTVGLPALHMLARKLLTAKVPVSPDQAADEAYDLDGLCQSSPVPSC